MPPEVALRTYRQNKKLSTEILKDTDVKEARGGVKASVVVIAGCQDSQYSTGGNFNGLFTVNLLHVWNDGAFKGSLNHSTGRLSGAYRQSRRQTVSAWGRQM
jgi:hypothetical protein